MVDTTPCDIPPTRIKKILPRWLCNVMTKAKLTHSLLTLHKTITLLFMSLLPLFPIIYHKKQKVFPKTRSHSHITVSTVILCSIQIFPVYTRAINWFSYSALILTGVTITIQSKESNVNCTWIAFCHQWETHLLIVSKHLIKL